MKRAFKMKYKAFFIIFQALSMKQITQFFLESDSPTLTCFVPTLLFQKQLFADVLENRCSLENHRKTLMLESLFSKVAKEILAQVFSYEFG